MNNYASSIVKSLRIYRSGEEVDGLSRQAAEKEVTARAKEFYEYDERNEDDSGSESDPYADEIDYEEKIGKVFTKKTLALLSTISHSANNRSPFKSRNRKNPKDTTLQESNRSPANFKR